MDTAAVDDRSFTHRMVRWCGWLAIGSGAVHAMTAIVYLLAERYPFRSPRLNSVEGLAQAFGLAMYCFLPGLQLAAGVGLLKWKFWARRLLIGWSVAMMGISFLSSALFTYNLISTNPTTRTAASWSYPTAWLWGSFQYWAQSCALPIMFLVVMLQPEVKRIWSRPAAGGFDVIPMAKAAEI